MTRYLFTILLISGNFSFDIVEQSSKEIEERIYGNWEYENVVINGKRIDASKLNQCGYKDILEIRSNSDIEEYEFDGEIVKGNQIGFSNGKSCSFSPIDYKHTVEDHSCGTYWIRQIANRKLIVSINDGVAIEYKIGKCNRRRMVLTKRREIINFGSIEPDEIVLKKIEKEN